MQLIKELTVNGHTLINVPAVKSELLALGVEADCINRMHVAGELVPDVERAASAAGGLGENGQGLLLHAHRRRD